VDAEDKCPDQAEDNDGFEDEDGCPEADNDGDGIVDAEDKCPDQAEDKDNFEDLDGCADVDNDGDGIADSDDKCIGEAETINGNNDDDGCPDSGDSIVMVMADRIELFEPIVFRGATDRILQKSHNGLGQVAATMRANPDFARIRIAAHVHPTGKNDRHLTQKRARAIKRWLVKWGIAPERLEIKGYGSSRLLVPRNQRGAKKINERVEFIILEKRIKR
ncbi:MAG: OmpA family protein, partial [Proteobacteria bacterium]|nr:OmpA family protein [Pseudomonadota bacterium]